LIRVDSQSEQATNGIRAQLYAACISGDATRVLEGALAASEGLTCAIETLTNSPDFDNRRVAEALLKFYSVRGRVTVLGQAKESLSASIDDDLFIHLIEQFAKKRTSINDAIVGCCLAELRTRRLRMDFSTYEVVKASFPNQRFQFKLADRGFVTFEMARPV
jgi:hypothetical protein